MKKLIPGMVAVTATALTFFRASTICGPGNGRKLVTCSVPTLAPSF